MLVLRSFGALVAASVLLSGCGGTGTAGPEPTHSTAGATAPVDAPTVPPCPPWDAEPAYPDGELPPGATNLRICPGDRTAAGPRTWKPAIAAPRDALTVGVEDLVTLVNGLPDWQGLPEDSYCTDEGRPRVHYVFGYPDGSSRSVTYGYGSCHLLELEAPGRFPDAGTVAKEDAAVFRDAVADALADQRANERPPRRVAAAPRCVPNVRPFTPLPVDRLALRTAAVCVLDEESRWRRAVLSPVLVERLQAELGGADPVARECPSDLVGKVVGRSEWDDPVELVLKERCVDSSGWSDAVRHWALSPGLVEDLLALPPGPPVPQR